MRLDSPVSNNGRGLKQAGVTAGLTVSLDSPVSNNGRGLKRNVGEDQREVAGIRPLAITGVD